MNNFQKRSMDDQELMNDWKTDPLLSRLDLLFESLSLDDSGCQQKLICELGKDPHNFSPLGPLVSSIFR